MNQTLKTPSCTVRPKDDESHRIHLRLSGRCRRLHGRLIVYQLPAEDKTPTPARLLQLLIPGSRRSGERAATELRERLHAHALSLPLPAAALALEEEVPHPFEVCSDLLTILSVMSKSAAGVYLRERTPNLALLTPGRRVFIFVPASWRESCPSSRI